MFRTASLIKNRSKEFILEETNKVINLYQQRGFKIADLHADLEFECIRNEIGNIRLGTVAKDDHVGLVERSIQTVKNTVHTTVSGLLFKRWTKLMIVELVVYSLRSLNQVLSPDGISDQLSPLTIVTGSEPVDFSKLKLEFGSYVLCF